MKLSTVLLAAGAGTRMKSSTPKILHTIFNKPLIQLVVESIQPLKSDNNIVVLSPDSDDVKKVLTSYPVTFAVQKMRLGTGDALKAAAAKLKNFRGTLLRYPAYLHIYVTKTLEKAPE